MCRKQSHTPIRLSSFAAKDKTLFYQVTLLYLAKDSLKSVLLEGQAALSLALVTYRVSGASAQLDTQVIHTAIILLCMGSQAMRASHSSFLHHEPSPLTLPV